MHRFLAIVAIVLATGAPLYLPGFASKTLASSGPLPNLEDGDLAGHFSPKSGWGFIDHHGKVVLPLRYHRVFCLKRSDETILVGVDGPVSTPSTTPDQGKDLPLEYAIYTLDGKLCVASSLFSLRRQSELPLDIISTPL